MKRRVAIIGTGWVGASVAISTLHSGIADELLLNDRRTEVAEGEAMDLGHGAPLYESATVRTAAIEEMALADAVVVTAGRGGRPGESRLDLLRDNASVIRDIGRRLKDCTGIIVMVTNPVDILTRVMTEASGLPPARVVGTGTMLDTARLRQTIGQVLSVDPHSIHAQVVGEHGDSSVVLWSSAAVGGVHVRDWPGWDLQSEPRIADEVRRAAYEIIRRKGATNHAIGIVTADLLRSMLRSERRIHTVSRVQEGALGIRDVALSLPAIVSAAGAEVVVEPELNADERAALEHSASVLRSAAASLS
jgi:L-lactate dehydrogenase